MKCQNLNQKTDSLKCQNRIARVLAEKNIEEILEKTPLQRMEFSNLLVGSVKPLKDGSYMAQIGEISPDPITVVEYRIYGKGRRPPLLMHTFLFSKDCKFQYYEIRQSPVRLKFYDHTEGGFNVSANFQCRFNEPNPQDCNGCNGLTAFYNLPFMRNVFPHETYVTLNHPLYYRGLCGLAQSVNN